MIPLVVVLLLLVPVAFDVAWRPNLRRIALRNAVRRKGEASVVVAGALLGTAIIVASMVVGKTMTESIRDEARTELGPIDVSVIAEDASQLPDIEAALVPLPVDADGTLAMVSIRAVAATTSEPRKGDAVAWVGEVDFDAARRLGPEANITGFADAGPTPERGQAVVNTDFAEGLELDVGDQFEVFAYGQATVLTIRDVVPALGVAGFNEVFVGPGVISGAFDRESSEFPPPRAELLVSAVGGVFDSVTVSEALALDLEALIDGLEGAQVFQFKKDLLDEAEAEGAEMTELFGGIGAFAIIAGVLLLVNLFVMLAEERKPELGLMRAVGMKRSHLVRAFAIEGALYALVAGILGAVLGVALGWVLVALVERIFSGEGASLRFALDADLLLSGTALGISISLVTAWATSFRIATVNIVRALRDLPEPPRQPGRATLAMAALAVVAGGILTFFGWSGENPIMLLAGPALSLFAAVPLGARLVGLRPARTIASVGALIWGIGVFGIFGNIMDTSEIATFVVQGVILVAAAVSLLAGIDKGWSRLSARLRGRSAVPARLGLAYPLAHRTRTGLLLGMFSLVIFTLTFLTVFTSIFDQQTNQWVADSSAGFDVVVDSSRVNPVSVDVLGDFDDVAAAAELDRGWTQFDVAGEEEPQWSVLTGFDETFLAEGGIGLSGRASEYQSDADVFRAVLSDPSLAIVSDGFLESFDGPGGDRLAVGESVTIVNPNSEVRMEVEIIGIAGGDFFFNGMYVSQRVSSEMLSDFTTPRHYVSVTSGSDSDDVASLLTGGLLENGVEASSFADAVAAEVGETISFVRVLQGFLALGLVIGIAGLGVMLVRAVRERRRQVGVMRAVGFGPKAIRRWFQFEAAFVAIQGIAIGVSLGLATAYQVIVNAAVFGDTQFEFSVSTVGLVLVVTIPLAAALGAAIVPSNQAAAIAPAVALRVAD